MDLVVCDHSDRLAADRPSLWLSGDQGAAAGEQGLGSESFWKGENRALKECSSSSILSPQSQALLCVKFKGR